jgi:hypothetical protein
MIEHILILISLIFAASTVDSIGESNGVIISPTILAEENI